MTIHFPLHNLRMFFFFFVAGKNYRTMLACALSISSPRGSNTPPLWRHINCREFVLLRCVAASDTGMNISQLDHPPRIATLKNNNNVWPLLYFDPSCITSFTGRKERRKGEKKSTILLLVHMEEECCWKVPVIFLFFCCWACFNKNAPRELSRAPLSVPPWANSMRDNESHF